MFNVKFFPKGDRDLLLTLASQHWDLCDYSQEEFTKLQYLRTFDAELSRLPMYVAFTDDKPCGIVILSEMVVDIHVRGGIRHIMGSLSLLGPKSGTLRALIRAVRDGGKREGLRYFTVPQRVNKSTIVIKYRRI